MVASQDGEIENPGPDDLYRVGVAGVVARMIKVPDGTLRILVHGAQRVRARRVRPARALPGRADRGGAGRGRALARARGPPPQRPDAPSRRSSRRSPTCPRSCRSRWPTSRTRRELAHMIAGALRIKTEEQQELLEERDVAKRLRRLSELLARELELISIGSQDPVPGRSPRWTRASASSSCASSSRRSRRSSARSTSSRPRRRSCASRSRRPSCPSTRCKQAERELQRFERLPPQSAEHGVIRTYLEWIVVAAVVEVAPRTTSTSRPRAQALDARPLRHREGQGPHPRVPRGAQAQARRALARSSASSGPPGVGKTSLGQVDRRRRWAASSSASRSAACATSPRSAATGAPTSARCRARSCARMRDAGLEQPGADDRRDRQDGRRLPRRPVERDARGARPRAELDASATTTSTCRSTSRGSSSSPPRTSSTRSRRALRDRMEVIQLAGLHRGGEARDRQALPGAAPDRAERARRSRRSSSPTRRCARSSTATRARPACATSSARSARSAARWRASSPRARASSKRTVRPEARSPSCSAGARFQPDVARRTGEPGVATGLAWTPVGGDVLFVEATAIPGEGKLQVTGQLGDVMKESAAAALSYVKRNAARAGRRRARGLVPRRTTCTCTCRPGAIPKDGPERGHHDGHRARLAGHRAAGALGHGDDRRDHPHRPGAADRRAQGEGARRAARRRSRA